MNSEIHLEGYDILIKAIKNRLKSIRVLYFSVKKCMKQKMTMTERGSYFAQ